MCRKIILLSFWQRPARKSAISASPPSPFNALSKKAKQIILGCTFCQSYSSAPSRKCT